MTRIDTVHMLADGSRVIHPPDICLGQVSRCRTKMHEKIRADPLRPVKEVYEEVFQQLLSSATEAVVPSTANETDTTTHCDHAIVFGTHMDKARWERFMEESLPPAGRCPACERPVKRKRGKTNAASLEFHLFQECRKYPWSKKYSA